MPTGQSDPSSRAQPVVRCCRRGCHTRGKWPCACGRCLECPSHRASSPSLRPRCGSCEGLILRCCRVSCSSCGDCSVCEACARVEYTKDDKGRFICENCVRYPRRRRRMHEHVSQWPFSWSRAAGQKVHNVPLPDKRTSSSRSGQHSEALGDLCSRLVAAFQRLID